MCPHLKKEKIGDDKLDRQTDRQTETFFCWLILGPIGLKIETHPIFFLGRSKKITDGSDVP